MIILGPTFIYHRSELPRLVSTQEEYDALGDGWADTPAAFYATPAPEPVAVEAQPESAPVEAPQAEPEAPAVCFRHDEPTNRYCVKSKGHRGAHTYRPAVPEVAP